ncbi:MAG: cysteine--tRNA ligase, partial [Bacilli bacterium]|nr:cysteine--tRNA ligase [Bacilli bacterium]
MKLYNTLTKKIEDFIPHKEGEVKIYTCGPTVYHYAHIGNMRNYIGHDVLVRTLKYLGFDVTRAMNITDVGHLTSDSDSGEDKMEVAKKREGKTAYEIADFYTEAFFKDFDVLNNLRPDITERATANIDMYIKMIEKLLADDIAYKSGGNIYFDISKVNNYYCLTNSQEDNLVVGAREGVLFDEHKRNQSDFALWFTTSKFENHEMLWDSPFGVGYPGWHIECSGISIKYLGEYLDIHGGGVDNIFPHHTNEIAQSEAYLGHKWCNYWCHGAHLNDKSGKMAKSKGGALTLTKLIDNGYSALDYRYFCLNSHYRSQLVFSYEAMDIAHNSLVKLKKRISNLNRDGDFYSDKFNYYVSEFKEAFESDINTAQMLTIVYDVLKDQEINDFTKYKLMEDFDKVLSLGLLDFSFNDVSLVDEGEILEKIEERNHQKEKEAFKICIEKIQKHKMEMKLVDAEYTFDNNKLLFYFT